MRSLLFLVLILFASTALAGQIAVTDTGEQVILNDDGTWQYASDTPSVTEIKTNPGIFVKDSKYSFQLKSTKNNSAFYVDPKVWRFEQGDPNSSESEYEFSLKKGDLYGQAITEELEIKLESLADIALENAREVARDARIVKREYRKVNGQKVIYQEMLATIQEVKFKFFGYYYSDASGSTQLVLYTGESLAGKYGRHIDGLLNGLAQQ